MKRALVVAAAGRRIDSDDADVARFPLARVDRVRDGIRTRLSEHDVAAVIASAACGADLLVLAEAGGLRIRRRAVLPFSPERFIETSVRDRPGGWTPLFRTIMRELQAAGEVVVLDETPGDAGYAATGEAILDEAEHLARRLGIRPAALVVWDGRPRSGVDLTRQFRESAERRGFEILEVSTLDETG
jgi:hypothetical protein